MNMQVPQHSSLQNHFVASEDTTRAYSSLLLLDLVIGC